RAAAARRARWQVAVARMRPGLGRQLDPRLLSRLCLARFGRRTADRGSELRPQPGPVPRANAVWRSRRQENADRGSTRHCRLRLERRRSANTRPIFGHAALEGMRLRAETMPIASKECKEDGLQRTPLDRIVG